MVVDFDQYMGHIELFGVHYRVAFSRGPSAVVHVQEDFCPRPCWWGPEYDFHPWQKTKGPVWNGIVGFNEEARPDLRAGSLALNVSCLTKIGGCKDAGEILPSIWGPQAIPDMPMVNGWTPKRE
jgi:hypothetical protein